jgi:hypothetical protein
VRRRSHVPNSKVMYASGTADPAALWEQSGGDYVKYRELLREHGMILYPGDPGYDKAPRNLPCGWPHQEE